MWRRGQTVSHGLETGRNDARSSPIGGRILMMMSSGRGGRLADPDVQTPSPYVCYPGITGLVGRIGEPENDPLRTSDPQLKLSELLASCSAVDGNSD